MNFKDLSLNIKQTHEVLQVQAGKDVNSFLTARNWIIGFYVVKYQQNGKDRAVYGDNLITSLAKELKIKGLSATNLKLSRQLYIVYPQLLEVIENFISTKKLELPIPIIISQLPTDQFKIAPVKGFFLYKYAVQQSIN